MTKRLMNIGGHFKNLIYDDASEAAIVITDENGDGSSFNGKALVGDANGKFIPTAGVTGNVVGPGTSTDNAVPRFDGITGALLQDSGVLIDDTDNMTIPGTLTLGSGAHVICNAAGLINGAKIQTLSIDPEAIAQDGATNGQALAWNGSQWAPTTLSGTIGGSTGASDNRLIRSDGVGGVTIQASPITVDDSGNMSGIGTVACGAITSTGAFSNSGYNLTTNQITCTRLILGSTSATARTFSIATADGANRTIQFESGASPTVDGYIRLEGATDDMVFVTGGSERLRIANGGGIDTPDTLHADGLIDTDFGFLASGGFLQCGVSGTDRGTILVYHGAGGNTAGYIRLFSRNGTGYYIWVEDDGTFKISSGAPVNNADGTVVGTQT